MNDPGLAGATRAVLPHDLGDGYAENPGKTTFPHQAEITGLAFRNPRGHTEARAMYGGLQAGIGVMTGLAVFRAELRRPALLTLLFLASGLGIARLLGVAIDAEVSAYTGIALAFEFTIIALSAVLLRSGDEVVAA